MQPREWSEIAGLSIMALFILSIILWALLPIWGYKSKQKKNDKEREERDGGGNGNPRRSPILRSWDKTRRPKYEVED